jgi:hypothetical protein
LLGFLLGAVAGGIASYYWRDTIRHYMSDRVPDLRKRAADGLGTLGGRAGGALDRARSRIDTAVRTGQERLRPTGTTAGSEPNERAK